MLISSLCFQYVTRTNPIPHLRVFTSDGISFRFILYESTCIYLYIYLYIVTNAIIYAFRYLYYYICLFVLFNLDLVSRDSKSLQGW